MKKNKLKKVKYKNKNKKVKRESANTFHGTCCVGYKRSQLGFLFN